MTRRPYQYMVIWRNSKGESKQFDTDCEHSALMMETRRNGTCYIDTKYEARLRLWNYINNKQRL